MEISTQYLGHIILYICLGFSLYKWFTGNAKEFSNAFNGKKTNYNHKWLQIASSLCIITLLYSLYSPIKTVMPKMSTLEKRERAEIVVPPKVTVEVETLEQAQEKLENKLDSKLDTESKDEQY